MVNNKKEFIEKLNTEELVQLFENLLPNMGLTSIKRTSANCVEVEISVPNAGNYINCYLFFNEPLAKGYPHIDILIEEINKKINSGCSKIYIVSNHSISTGLQLELERGSSKKKSIEFYQNSDILTNIENNYSDYWRHTDQSLISYEKEFENKMTESFQIKKLVEYKAAYQKLLSIFIEPNLFLRTDDKQSTKKAFTKIHLERVIDENDRLLMLHGDPGTGKTRLLNEIGRLLINRNTKNSGKRYLPIFIDTINLRDTISEKGEIDICTLILENRLKEHFEGLSFDELVANYQLVLLVDSIDEFEEKFKTKITNELESLMDKGILVFLGTRSNTLEAFKKSAGKNLKDVYIQKFNNQQVEKFASRYFEGKGNRAEGLLESLRENKILDKLPVTPLNLSLMSILYEETNQQELPATLNDIYDKFSNLLLGRTMVDKSIDFLDITVKENILGTYALELLKRKNSELLTKDEFIKFFEDKLSSISGTIDISLLPKALDFIIEHTGLLVLQRGNYVKFRHDSYMEYFAAKEIFKNHREMEDDLVENFFDVNWQFAAVFYGGQSRRMSSFLEKIIKKIKKSSTMQEYWASANGTGYLLQALYLTDDEIRKNAVVEVLKLMVDTYEGFKKLSSSLPENVFLSRFPLPILSIFPIFLFQDNFDSITLRKPLSMALDELLELYEEKKNVEDYPYLDNIIYQILILSITVSSSRLNMEEKLTEVIGKIKTTGNDFYTKLLEASIENLGSKELRKQKDEILNPKRVRKSDNHPYHIKKSLDIYIQPASRHRFGKYDKIRPNRRVKLFVEGPSDAILLEQAYTALTGHIPYWEIKVGDPTGGNANSLAKALNEGLAYLDDDQMVIGIFDNDGEGQQQFDGTLHKSKFDYIENYTRIKKRKEGNIYGMLLPIPENLQHYIQPKQTDNYFSIEHYFSKELLSENNMIKVTAIPEIYCINDSGGAKMAFAKKMAKINDYTLFNGFIILFKEIDKLAGMEGEIEYKE